MTKLQAAMGPRIPDLPVLLHDGALALARLHRQTLQEKVEAEVATLQRQRRKVAGGGRILFLMSGCSILPLCLAESTCTAQAPQRTRPS